MKEEINLDALLKAGKVAVGIIDVSFVAKKVSDVINPKPVKAKGFWRKK